MQYNDPDFGTVTLTVNLRARSIIMRPKVDGLRITVFPGATLSLVKKTIDKYRQQLKAKQETLKQQPKISDEDIERMRRAAKAKLPRRLAELAHLYGFKYESVKIQCSKTRWGSCSGKNSINLSLFLMLAPEHLQDYVMLHELCHTVHHNHSAQFWELMDKVTDGKAHSLRKELKEYTP